MSAERAQILQSVMRGEDSDEAEAKFQAYKAARDAAKAAKRQSKGLPWTPEEDEKILAKAKAGIHYKVIAVEHKRPAYSMKKRIDRLISNHHAATVIKQAARIEEQDSTIAKQDIIISRQVALITEMRKQLENSLAKWEEAYGTNTMILQQMKKFKDEYDKTIDKCTGLTPFTAEEKTSINLPISSAPVFGLVMPVGAVMRYLISVKNHDISWYIIENIQTERKGPDGLLDTIIRKLLDDAYFGIPVINGIGREVYRNGPAPVGDYTRLKDDLHRLKSNSLQTQLR